MKSDSFMALAEWRRLKSPYKNYEVSSEGDIRRAGKVLKGYINRYGYRTVLLYYGGIGKRHTVHRLVCAAFHGEPANGEHAAHNDGNKANNRQTNLRWASPKSNAADKVLHGTDQRGSRHPQSKLSELQVQQIIASTASCRTEAAKHGITCGHVSRIRNGVRWSVSASKAAALRASID